MGGMISKRKRSKAAANILPEIMKNPLLGGNVLKKIFCCLSVSDLKFCRLVHSLWNQEANHILQKRCNVIQVLDEEKILQFTKCFQTSPKQTPFPASRFNLATSLFQPHLLSASGTPVVFLQFLRFISLSVTELTITFSMLSEFRVTVGNFPNDFSFPNLKTLRIANERSVANFSDSVSLLSIVLKIVQCSPILQNIICQDLPEKETLSVLKCLKFCQDVSTISQLSLHGFITDEHVEELIQIGLKLKIFKAGIWWDLQVKPLLFHKFLETQRETLEYLEIKQRDDSPCYKLHLDFPRMEKLKQIYIDRVNSPSHVVMTIAPIEDYQITFPVLETLSLKANHHLDSWDDILNPECKGCCNTVTELQFLGGHVASETLLSLSKFPFVTKLEIPASVEIVSLAVLLLSEQLEELTLHRGSGMANFIDHIITGRRLAECNKIRKNGKGNLTKMRNMLNRTVPSRMSVACLKNLKVLALRDNLEKYPLQISDVGCVELIQIHSLKRLVFSGRNSSAETISEKMLLKMRKQFLVLF